MYKQQVSPGLFMTHQPMLSFVMRFSADAQPDLLVPEGIG